MALNPIVQVGSGAGAVRFGAELPLSVIAGPCQLESRAHALEMASALKEIAARREDRPRLQDLVRQGQPHLGRRRAGHRPQSGPADLRGNSRKLGLPVLTDVHEPGQCAIAAQAVDVLQIPAFLCRQTDLLIAAARTGCGGQRQEGPVPGALGHAARGGENRSAGGANVLVTERGVSFGYNTLVSDMRALPILRARLARR